MSGLRIALIAAIGLSIGGAVLWLRSDAVRDDRARQDAAAHEARIDHMTGAKELHRDIQNLDRTEFDDAIDGLPGHAPDE